MPDLIELFADAPVVEILDETTDVVEVSADEAPLVEVLTDELEVVEVVTDGPQGRDGPPADPEVVAAEIGALVAAYLVARPAQVYAFPDPVATWPMPHSFGRIPAVTLYSTAGRQIRTDVDVDATHASARFPYPVPGYAVLT